MCSSVTRSAPTSWCVRQSQCLHQHLSGPTSWCVHQSQCLHQHPSVLVSHNVCTNILVCSSVTMSVPTPEWTNMLVFRSVTISTPTSWCVNSQCLHQHPTPHRQWAKPNGRKEHREQTPSVGALQSTTEPQPVSSVWSTRSQHSKHGKQLTTSLLQLPPLDTARKFQFSIK